jgi:hypothetical protein
LTATTSPAARHALASLSPGQFALRVAFLAVTGALLVVWLAAV